MRLEMAKSFAKKAAEIAMRHYKRTEGRRKGNEGIVTAADGEIEEFVKKRIREVFPAERILGEETGFSEEPGESTEKSAAAENAGLAGPARTSAKDDLLARLGGPPKKQTVKELFKNMPAAPVAPVLGGAGDVLWAIDPIDGTSAFASGLPIWAISIGIVTNGIPDLGVMSIPAIDELFWGDKDGVFLNGKEIKPRAGVDEFDSETAVLVPSNAHRKYQLDFTGKTRSMGSLAAHMAFVAAGAADAAILGRPHLWDIAAGAAFILRQGGTILTFSGKPCDWAPMVAGERSSEPLIAGPEKTIRALLSCIKIRSANTV